jgi:hypothetical protein
LLGEGRIVSAAPIIALQWLELNRHWLRKLWRSENRSPGCGDLLGDD